MIKVGCCGYTVGKSKYHESFGVVELQQPFFQPPSQRVLGSWRSGAPKDFEFVLKAWQLITHDPMSQTYEKLQNPIPDFRRMNYGGFKPTNEVRRAWETTENEADILQARIIVFQCQSSFKPTEENLNNIRAFFGKVERKGRVFVFEPRGWKEAELKPLCEELDLAGCIDPFRPESCFGSIKYVRMAGKGGYNYRYTENEINAIIKRYKDDPGEVYVMFNNSNMLNDAYTMKRLLETGDQG